MTACDYYSFAFARSGLRMHDSSESIFATTTGASGLIQILTWCKEHRVVQLALGISTATSNRRSNAGSRIDASVILFLLAAAVMGCQEPQRRNHHTPAPTASELLAEVDSERYAGRPLVALEHAQKLISDYPGTIEADSASRIMTLLQLAVEAAAADERTRAAEATAAAAARRLAEKWSYSREVDQMTSRVSRRAIIWSENTVNFAFPYNGPQRGTLIIRDHPSYGHDVILAIEKGQFLCRSYEDCRIRVRFDEAPARTWNAIGPADNSTTLIFLRNEARFVQELRNAAVVRIQASVFREGEPIFEFHVGGFDYARYAGN